MARDAKPAGRWINGIEPSKELLAANGTQILEIECREQPARLRDLLEAYREDAEIQKQLAGFRKFAASQGPVLFIGMGGSYCSSISAAVHLQSHGRPGFFIDAGEWLHYAEPVWNEAALSVLITTSGESAELVALLKHGGKNPCGENPLGLICNNTASTCWNLSEHRLLILAGPEYGNATKTYTNSTAAAIILASEILEIPWQQDAQHACEVFSDSLEPIFARRSELEAFCRDAANIEIIGRGAAYGAAVMSALTIREMSGRRAAPHTGAGFRHGPNLDVDGSHLAMILALGRTSALGVKLAEECNGRGGKVLLVSSENHERTDRLFPIKLEAVAEPWESITSLVVSQALTLAMVERTGCRLPPRFLYGNMEQ